ncbi:MAG: RNA polymerase sigma-70 factor [Draconibacterium sp.]|nr:RNA polymerase sigma-70 factor [Draconibacterium sp.]
MVKLIEPNIFDKIKSGDEIAFSKLFDEQYPLLCFFCDGYIADIDKARSLVQQVFVDLWIKREKLNITHSIKSYMYNAVRNKTIDFLRQQKNTIQITAKIENTQKIPFQNIIQEAEINNRINNSINQLPEKCREIFILCRFEGLKYKQVAEKLNISIKTVEMQMGIALKKLRKSLSGSKSINLFAILISKRSIFITG